MYKNIVLYPVCSCKLRHLIIKKTLKELMEMLGDSLFYSQLVILSSLQSKPDSLFSSENPCFTPADKFNF